MQKKFPSLNNADTGRTNYGISLRVAMDKFN